MHLLDAHSAKHLAAFNRKNKPSQIRAEFEKCICDLIQSAVNNGLNSANWRFSEKYFGDVDFAVKDLKNKGYQVSLSKERIEIKW